MSAFVVSNGTMDRVVTAILRMRQSFAGVPTTGDKLVAATEIARELYAMNGSAVAQRYPGDPEFALPAYRWRPSGLNAVAEYKAVQCLVYQCSEGSVPETDLYRELEAVARRLAAEIIRVMPAYDKAPWDCDRADPRYRMA